MDANGLEWIGFFGAGSTQMQSRFDDRPWTGQMPADGLFYSRPFASIRGSTELFGSGVAILLVLKLLLLFRVQHDLFLAA
jgi:hypothetical protein